MTTSLNDPFWQVKNLDEMTEAEWELLCDGCGKCCLVKLEDEDTGEIYHTNVVCKLLDLEACECNNYQHRQYFVDDCLKLIPSNIGELTWLPNSCAYRVIARGEELPPWHHLVTGCREDVHNWGMSVRGWVSSESDVSDRHMQDRIIQWVD